MKGKRQDRGKLSRDAAQLKIDWHGGTSTPPVDSSKQQSLTDTNGPLATMASSNVTDPQPVQRLRWDFCVRFPEPLPEVLDAGMMSAEDVLPESIEAIHREHGRRMSEALSDIDAAMEERCSNPSVAVRRGAETVTEPTRLEWWYTNLLGVYEEWFGKEAAEAFDKAVRAWHAHIEVVVEHDNPRSSTAMGSLPPERPQLSTESQDVPPFIAGEICDPPALATAALRNPPKPEAKQIIARLPVPKPLASAVAAGHFGADEQGQPIEPSADEVFEITRAHAEKLIELYQSPTNSSPPAGPSVEDRIRTNLEQYAEDFGDHATQQLNAYARRQARIRDDAPVSRGR